MVHYKVKISTHILLEKDNKILLGLMKSNIDPDGVWGLIAGHLEPYENVTDAIIREFIEEIGIHLTRDSLKLSLVMHGRNPEYIGFFYI